MSLIAPLAGLTVIYGGSFDPPHMGHQMACLALIEGLGCQQVLLTPAFAHPFGKKLTAFAHRFAMCSHLAAPFGARVQVSAAERDLQGAGRTYDLVTSLQASHPGKLWALAIGADIVGETHLWHRWPELEALVRVVIIGRTGYAARGTHTPDLPDIASSRLRQRLRDGQNVAGELPVSVGAYLSQHNLYGASNA